LKGKGPTGAAAFSPLSTGITYALTEKASADKIPLITMGYGRSESVDGSVFMWNFPLLGTYWDAADVLIQHIGNLNGGLTSSRARRLRSFTTTRRTARSRFRCFRSAPDAMGSS
jgi:branched-chain amino acid transport system substrate-binding protein